MGGAAGTPGRPVNGGACLALGLGSGRHVHLYDAFASRPTTCTWMWSFVLTATESVASHGVSPAAMEVYAARSTNATTRTGGERRCRKGLHGLDGD
jgi:hypothetical protein